MAAARSTAREYLEALLVAAIFLGFSNTFVLKTFYIPSGSMEDTLLIGDHLFVNRFIFGPAASALEYRLLPLRRIERGDIVIFRSPENVNLDLVKRCIAVGGDEVRVVAKQLLVNGEPRNEVAYAHYAPPRRGIVTYGADPREDYGPTTVPAIHYFCMGDNRVNSNDSRFWGTVPEAMVKGRAFVVYWSYGGETPDGTWRGWSERLRQLGRTVVGFFPKTRWWRTFHLVR